MTCKVAAAFEELKRMRHPEDCVLACMANGRVWVIDELNLENKHIRQAYKELAGGIVAIIRPKENVLTQAR